MTETNTSPIILKHGDTTIYIGTEGDDGKVGSRGDDLLYGSSGNDKLHGGAGADTILGGDGDDTLDGGSGDDLLDGGRGDDTISGGFDYDTLHGGAGNDRLDGDEGNDTLDGGAGNDRLDGGTGVNRLKGGAGADIFRMSWGANYATNDVVNNTITDFEVGVDRIEIFDSLTGQHVGFRDLTITDHGTYTLVSYGRLELKLMDVRASDLTKDDFITETLHAYDGWRFGGEGRDVLHGGDGDDYMRGYHGPDELHGGGGNDTMHGDTGADTLRGGAGDDTMTGGNGADTFVPEVSGNGDDRITDFQPGRDRLAFEDGGIAFADLTIAQSGKDTVVSWAGGSVTLTGVRASTFTERDIVFGDGTSADGIVLKGTDGNDELNGLGNADRLEGLGGDDTLDGGAGDDTLDGGDGNDTLHGGDGDDRLDGGAGNDRMTGGDGADTFILKAAGNGNDRITDFRPGWDRLAFEDGGIAFADLTITQSGKDTVVSWSGGQVTLAGVTASKVTEAAFSFPEAAEPVHGRDIRGTANNDKLRGGDGNDKIWGLAGMDTLHGGDGNDKIWGLAGMDTLHGGDGDDRLYGGANSDVLYGNAGDDELHGGADEDWLYGGAGADTFFLERTGNGNDIIYDFEDGRDRLAFSETGIAFADLEIRQSGPDAVVSWDGGSVRLKDVDHTALTPEDFVFPAVVETSRDQDIRGTGNADTLRGGHGKDAILGLGGDDTIDGGGGDDTLRGGGGDDTMTGGNGADTFILERTGNGDDRITDFEPGRDRMAFAEAGIAFGDLRIRQSDGDTVVSWAGGSATLAGVRASTVTERDLSFPEAGTATVIQDQELGGHHSRDLQGGDGDDRLNGGFRNNTIHGGAGNDWINGAKGADRLDGGAGDDYVTGGLGDDVMTGGAGRDVFGLNRNGGNGDDRITDFRQGQDRLAFMGLGPALGFDDLTITRSSDDAVVSWAGGSVVLQGVRAAGLTAGDFIFTTDPFLFKAGNPTANRLTGTEEGQRIYGFGGDDTLAGGGGDDGLYGGTGDDTLAGGDGDDRLYGGAGDDTLTGGDGDDELHGGAGDDTLAGDGGTDTLAGGDGDDRLDGGADDDTLTGGYGADTFVIRTTNNGDDTVTDFRPGWDRLEFAHGGPAFGDLDIRQDGDGTVIRWYGGTVTLKDVDARGITRRDIAFPDASPGLDVRGGDGDDTLRGGHGKDTILGLAGDDTIDGGGGDDTIDGGTGDDTLTGGYGADTFVLRKTGNGADRITDFEPGRDRLAFNEAGIVFTDLTIIARDGDTEVRWGGGSVTLADVVSTTLTERDFDFKAPPPEPGRTLTGGEGVDTLTGGEGPDTIKGNGGFDILTGRGGNDIIEGGAGDDRLDGGFGDDRLDGGAGNDLMRGGQGADTFVLRKTGNGADRIRDFGLGRDRLAFAEPGMAFAALAITQSGADTMVSWAGGSVRLEGVDASTVTEADFVFPEAPVRALDIDGGDGDDTLIGGEGDDTIDGGAGDDTIEGRGGNDTLNGGAGEDTVIGGEGNDTITGGDDGDVLEGWGGDDTIEGGKGGDQLVGGDGDDTLKGDAGYDRLLGGRGDDTLEGGGGNDVLEGGDGDDTLDGGRGRDTLWGDGGADTFVFRTGDGRDTVMDFEDGKDLIRIDGVEAADFGDLAITDGDGGVHIVYGDGDRIILRGMDSADVTQEDFRFDILVNTGIGYGTIQVDTGVTVDFGDLAG